MPVSISSSAPAPRWPGVAGRTLFDLLMEADANGVLAPSDLPMLGQVAYAAGYLDVAIETWERALRAAPDDPTRQSIKEHLVGLL